MGSSGLRRGCGVCCGVAAVINPFCIASGLAVVVYADARKSTSSCSSSGQIFKSGSSGRPILPGSVSRFNCGSAIFGKRQVRIG
ncbi:hypothetical protein DY000_02058669 [Brassica cretica]|uniref:Secreted protein n=1 Tax=Brassica cretica TaxID=69181 RepID=A0ABQ7AM63_BRACR|nr:hypothetical protein DY000_02058669 [Brassica cretica]